MFTQDRIVSVGYLKLKYDDVQYRSAYKFMNSTKMLNGKNSIEFM